MVNKINIRPLRHRMHGQLTKYLNKPRNAAQKAWYLYYYERRREDCYLADNTEILIDRLSLLLLLFDIHEKEW